ncbi:MULTISPECIES: hypothetical protein [Kitasatospora]
MTTQPSPLRADARRNRERIPEAAVRAFSENGPPPGGRDGGA